MNFCIVLLILKHILSEPWLIDARVANSLLPLVSNFAKGDVAALSSAVKHEAKHVLTPDGSTMVDNAWHGIDCFRDAPPGSIAFINIQGVMTKNNQPCGPIGTAALLDQFTSAQNNDNIVGTILVTDTPGGQVSGTVDLATAIRTAKKPVVSYINGMACSAGYWISSGASVVMASNELVEVGSIGVMCTLIDESGAYEKEGLKIKTLYATKSTKKNKPYRDSLEGDDTLILSQLDEINSVFESSVRKARAGKIADKDGIFEGEVFTAKAAKKLGLIDSIGTMTDAVNYIRNFSKTKTMSKKNNAETYPHFTQAVGFPNGFEATEEGVHINMEAVQSIETALATSQQQAADLQANVDALTATGAEVAAANSAQATQIASLQEQIATLQTENEQLKGQRSSKGAAPAAVAPETPVSETESPYVDDGSQAILDSHVRRRN